MLAEILADYFNQDGIQETLAAISKKIYPENSVTDSAAGIAGSGIIIFADGSKDWDKDPMNLCASILDILKAARDKTIALDTADQEKLESVAQGICNHLVAAESWVAQQKDGPTPADVPAQKGAPHGSMFPTLLNKIGALGIEPNGWIALAAQFRQKGASQANEGRK